jgi:hypothetical protein
MDPTQKRGRQIAAGATADDAASARRSMSSFIAQGSRFRPAAVD